MNVMNVWSGKLWGQKYNPHFKQYPLLVKYMYINNVLLLILFVWCHWYQIYLIKCLNIQSGLFHIWCGCIHKRPVSLTAPPFKINFLATENWPKMKLKSVWILWKIIHLASGSHIWSFFAQKHMLTKSKSRSIASQITNLASRKSYLVIILHPIHIKRWPKVKSGQVGVGSNIAQNRLFSP